MNWAEASHEELLAALVTLTAQVVDLQGRLAERDARIERQEGRIAALEEKLASATATSRTSSKPPSSDGYRKPAPTSSRKSSGRRPGGQSGSVGTTLRQVPDPDVVIEYRPAACGGCAASLDQRPVLRVARRQVADLPRRRLRWTEHQIATVRCGCGRACTAGVVDGVPADVAAPVQYGPRVKATAAYLMNWHYLPVARCASAMADLLGAPVSAGSVMTWQAQGALTLAADDGFLDVVRDQLRHADVLHADETGLRVQGSLAWVHVAATVALVLLSVHVGDGRRGKAAMQAGGVIEHLRADAVLVSDAWAPYLTYAMLHALCGAHLVRELRAVAESGPACTTDVGSQSWAGKLGHLLEGVNACAQQARRAGEQQIDPRVLAEKVAAFEKIIALGWEQNPAPPGGWRQSKKKRPKAVNLLLRMEDHREDYLRFAHDLSVPFTNNEAERDLRGVRLREKVSGCLRTLAGARAFVAMRSYLLTAARNGQDALDVLSDLYSGRPWMPSTATC